MPEPLLPDTSSHPELAPTRELTKAFLFLRTATAAIKNLKAQIKSTDAYIQYNSINGNYTEHCAYQAEQDEQEKDLKIWERRYAQAGAGLVHWMVKIKLGKFLPGEIVNLIAKMLFKSDDLVLPDIW